MIQSVRSKRKRKDSDDDTEMSEVRIKFSFSFPSIQTIAFRFILFDVHVQNVNVLWSYVTSNFWPVVLVHAMQVDFCQLQVNTLRRYKRHYKLQTRPGLNKSQLVEVGFYENEYNLKTSALI